MNSIEPRAADCDRSGEIGLSWQRMSEQKILGMPGRFVLDKQGVKFFGCLGASFKRQLR
jgi:hypothetical protein